MLNRKRSEFNQHSQKANSNRSINRSIWNRWNGFTCIRLLIEINRVDLYVYCTQPHESVANLLYMFNCCICYCIKYLCALHMWNPKLHFPSITAGSQASEINALALRHISVIHSFLFTHPFQFQAQVNHGTKSPSFPRDHGPVIDQQLRGPWHIHKGSRNSVPCSRSHEWLVGLQICVTQSHKFTLQAIRHIYAPVRSP